MATEDETGKVDESVDILGNSHETLVDVRRIRVQLDFQAPETPGRRVESRYREKGLFEYVADAKPLEIRGVTENADDVALSNTGQRAQGVSILWVVVDDIDINVSDEMSDMFSVLKRRRFQALHNSFKKIFSSDVHVSKYQRANEILQGVSTAGHEFDVGLWLYVRSMTCRHCGKGLKAGDCPHAHLLA
jgi:hypothetical protein